jgi:hypothetical protein
MLNGHSLNSSAQQRNVVVRAASPQWHAMVGDELLVSEALVVLLDRLAHTVVTTVELEPFAYLGTATKKYILLFW